MKQPKTRRQFLTSSGKLTSYAILVPSLDFANKTLADTPHINGYANVKNFGAIGDGSHDDTAPIQSAIDSLNMGGIVFFPPGSYMLSSSLKIRSRLSIIGASTNAVTLLPQASNSAVFDFSSSSHQTLSLEISSLEINAKSTKSVTGISIVYGDWIKLSHLVFTGCSINVFLDRCRNVDIINCVAYGNSTNSCGSMIVCSTTVGADDYISNVNISNYTAYNTGSGINEAGAIIINRGIAVFILNFILYAGYISGNSGNAVAGISFYGDCQGCKVSGGLIAACSYGVYFGHDYFNPNEGSIPSFCTVTNLDVDQPQTAGICIVEGHHITLTGGNYTASSNYQNAAGIIAQGGQHFLINMNTISQFAGENGNGILIAATISDVTITGCQIDLCGNGIGVRDGAGPNFYISGNRLTGNRNSIIYLGNKENSIIRQNIGAPDIS